MPKTPIPSPPTPNRFLLLIAGLGRSLGPALTTQPATTAPGRSSGQSRLFLAIFLSMCVSSVASAFTAPAAGDFGYDVYDIVVNKILDGPIGFIGGLFLIVLGVTQIMKNWMMTILCIIAGTVLIRAEAMVITLGAMVS